jgi:hypothetical protein
MGGSYEERLPGPSNLRIHEKSGDIHVHDDARRTKLKMPVADFKKAYAKAKKVLEKGDPKDCVATVDDGTGMSLVGELNGNAVEWRLESTSTARTKSAPVLGFDALDRITGKV